MKSSIVLLVFLFGAFGFSYCQELDTNFGINGITIHTFSNVYTAQHQSCFLQNDGKILNAGYAYEGNYLATILVTRHLSDGTLDTSFDTDGALTFTYGQNFEEANSIVQLTNGKILVGGASFGNAVLAMLNNDGSFETGFGIDGKRFITTGQGNGSKIEKILQQPDGKILVFGRAYNGNDFDFMISRINLDGNFDSSFGSNGIVLMPISNFHDFGMDAAFQSDGKIVVAGYSTSSQDSVSVIRLNLDGTIDTTFATNGKYNAVFGSSLNVINAVAIQSDDKIVLAGSVSGGAFSSIETLTIRLQANGQLDTTFNGNGFTTVDLRLNAQDNINDVVILSNGEIVIMGSSNLYSDFALLKFNSNGTISNGFGTNGRFFIPVGNAQNSWINEAILMPNNDLILCGLTVPELGDKGQFGLVKLTGLNLAKNNFEDRKPLKIFSNPVSEFITIDVEDDFIGSELKLTNLQGQLVFQSNVVAVNQIIGVSELPSGIYLLSVQKDDKIFTHKIVKE